MADKAISELIAAEQITATDNFVLEQNNTAKKLTGQVLLNWLTRAADGHGGIQDITGPVVSGLDKTYTIILADQTEYTFTVRDGNGIASFAKTGTEGLVDTYRLTYDDGTYYDMAVANGAKGDKGDNAYVHFKWASQDPSIPPHSIGDVPDNWQGVYSGNSETAPTDWQEYKWFKCKGEQGKTGEAAKLVSQAVEYQVSDSGTIYPSGAWSTTVPVVPAGKYLWTRTTLTFNTGEPVVSYSVGRMGIDGSGAVSFVNNVSPDANGNVSLTAENVGAMAAAGGAFTGPVNMSGQPLDGLNPPTQSDQAANKGYVDSETEKLESKKLEFHNISVPVAGFVANTDPDTLAAGFAYMVPVALENVMENMIPIVTISAVDTKSGNIAPVAKSYNGGIYLYAKAVPQEDMTVPTIILFRGYGQGVGLVNSGGGTGGGVNPNLLDNWYFTNPVNTRNAATRTTAGYFIDRWRFDPAGGGEVKLVDGYLRITQNSVTDDNRWQAIYQDISKSYWSPGDKITVSALYRGTGRTMILVIVNDESEFKKEFAPSEDVELAEYTMVIPDDATSIAVFVYADIDGGLGYTEFLAIKCERGDTQTLAYKNADGKLTLSEIPRYGEMIRKCRRYRYMFSWLGGGSNFAPIRVYYTLPEPMRAVPVATHTRYGGSGTVNVLVIDQQTLDITVSGDYAAIVITLSAET